MSSNQSGGEEIRKTTIAADLVDCMVSVPPGVKPDAYALTELGEVARREGDELVLLKIFRCRRCGGFAA